MATIYTVGSGQTYSTIQSAINAVPSTLDDNYEIVIYDGSYAEALSLSKTTGSYTLTFKAATGNTVNVQSFGDIYDDNIIIQDLHFNSTSGAVVHFRPGADNCILERCEFANGSKAWVQSASTIRNCLIYGFTGYMGVRYGALFYNNTIYCDVSSTLDGIINVRGTIEVRNNIFINVTTGTVTAIRADAAVSDTYSNNIWHFPNASSVNWYQGSGATTYAEFVTYTGETGGYNQDPLLTNAPTDFTLTSSSIAINNGYDTGITLDYASTARDASIDIGAYEFAEQGSPLLCWSLTGRYKNGRAFTCNGPDKFPGLDKLSLPELSNITVIEDGRKII